MQKKKIIQIIDASGWCGLYKAISLLHDDKPFSIPLAAWALYEEKDPLDGSTMRLVEGLTAQEMVDWASEDGDQFVCYMRESEIEDMGGAEKAVKEFQSGPTAKPLHGLPNKGGEESSED